MQEHERIKVGISSCLLGNEVRFDGGRKRHSYITGTLASILISRPCARRWVVGGRSGTRQNIISGGIRNLISNVSIT